MKKNKVNLIVSLLIIAVALTCSDGIPTTMEPQKVHRLIYEEKPMDWYETQSELWKKVVDENPTDPAAWYNYFMASKYSNWRKDVETYMGITNGILAEMKEYLPDSYEYNYLMYYNGTRDLNYLEKAYQVDPIRPDALYEFILHYEKNGNQENLKKFCIELYNTRDISPGLLNYNYNVLASTEKNAILFTNGDNDSYPAWVLQNKFDIRNDVLILNLHLTFVDREYFKRKLSERGIDLNVEAFSKNKMHVFLAEFTKSMEKNYPQFPIYTAATVYSESTKDIKENLYLIGLALKYSVKRFDNVARIKDNLNNNLRLDYLTYDWYSDQYLIKAGLDRLNMNYVVVFLKLAEAYYDSGHHEEANKWRGMALELAETAKNEKFIQHINELDW
jgi:hypothetical protein